MPNFWTMARRLGDAATGFAAGDLARQKMLADERTNLMKLSIDAGAQGIDASKLVSPDMVLPGNQDYVANTMPGLGSTLVKGYQDKIGLQQRQLDLTGRQLDITQMQRDDQRAHYERADANAARQINATERYRTAQVDATNEARAARLAQAQQIADAKLAQQDFIGAQAIKTDQEAAKEHLTNMAVARYTNAFGKAPYTTDAKGNQIWDPVAQAQIQGYVNQGLGYLDQSGVFKTKKSEYTPGMYRDAAGQFDKMVGDKKGESNFFSPDVPNAFDFSGVRAPARGGIHPDNHLVGDPSGGGQGGDAFSGFLAQQQDLIRRAPTADARQSAINNAVAEFAQRVRGREDRAALISEFRNRLMQ